jgi:hypothetical protein
VRASDIRTRPTTKDAAFAYAGRARSFKTQQRTRKQRRGRRNSRRVE